MAMFVVTPSYHPPSQHDHSLMSDPHLLIPLLTATPCLNADDLVNTRPAGPGNHHQHRSTINLWQQNQQQVHYNKSKSIDFQAVGSGTLFSGGGGAASSGSGGTATCQDCGNQAKKDCSHRRCRTCCRSRGFDCTTHVKSTWVPASRRRERQMMGVAGAGGSGGGGGGASSGSTSGAKKPRLISSQNTATSSPSNTPSRSFDTSSSHQDASFKDSLPGQVRAPAVFKCVRVTAVEDGEDEFAYQAVVKIGGHIFKGFLYDQGLEQRDHVTTSFPNLSELHLGGGPSGSGGVRGGPNCSASLVDPSVVYGATGTGTLLGGSTYGFSQN